MTGLKSAFESAETGYSELKFELPGQLLAARCWGEKGKPVVLALHGWLDNAASFNALAPLLSNYQVVAIDFAGHGRSGRRPDETPYYVWDNVADVLHLLDHLQEEWGLSSPVHLLGHSMGAGIASMFAACYPERVAGLMLIEGIGPVITPAEDVAGQLRKALQKRRRIRKRQPNIYTDYQSAVAARTAGAWPVSARAAGWLAERGVSQNVEGGGYFWSHDPWLTLPSPLRLTEEQVRGFLREIRCPVQIILGHDGVTQNPERISSIADCQVLRLAGGHHLHMEPETAETIARYFNDPEYVL